MRDTIAGSELSSDQEETNDRGRGGSSRRPQSASRPRGARSGRIRKVVARLIICLGATSVGAMALTSTASAATNPWGGIAQTDVTCDSYFQTLDFYLLMTDTGGLQGYRLHFWHETTGRWSPTEWYLHNGSIHASHSFVNVKGLNAVYVEYAWMTTSGWQTTGEYASHRQSWAGMTPTGYYTSCYT